MIPREYPKARGLVDGRAVLNPRTVPDRGSIESTLFEYEILPELREVPMAAFPEVNGRHYSVQGNQRIKELAGQIQLSKKISPLIVVTDREGPYILEGATRIEALYRIGAKSFPALVVIDLENPPPGYKKLAATTKERNMSDLRTKVIRLAHEKPALRPVLLPLLKEAGDLSKLPPALREQAEKKQEEAKKNKDKGKDDDDKKTDKKAALSFSNGTVDIAMPMGQTQTVNALLVGNWAIHKVTRGSGWMITHVPSGMSIAKSTSGKKAKATLEMVLESFPALLNASESDVRAQGKMLQPLLAGELPFAVIMRQEGLMNLGKRYSKAGDHWGNAGGSMMIRVGGRDLVLTEFTIRGQTGRGQLEGTWGMVDIEGKKKITKTQLLKWIQDVKAAPSMQAIRDEFRATQ